MARVPVEDRLTSVVVTGCQYRQQDSVKAFIEDKRHTVSSKQLAGLFFEPEPENIHDSKAIAVWWKDAKGADHHVGYVGREDQKRVARFLRAWDNLHEVEYVTWWLVTSTATTSDDDVSSILIWLTVTIEVGGIADIDE